MTLSIIDSMTAPSTVGGRNEDAFGWTENSVFVIDGATGLADQTIMPDCASDAAWLARLAAEHFSNADQQPVEDTVRNINTTARDTYFKTAGTDDLPRHAWPAAAFQMLRLEGETFVTYGLGDCRLFLLNEKTGQLFDTSALKENRANEIAAARAHLTRIGGFKGASNIRDDGETLASLRAGRAKHNTPDGRIFTIGLVPDAADKIVREEISFSGPVRGLLCSDGFAALCDHYEAFTAGSLITEAFEKGLAPLMQKLRDIEHIEDPDGQRYPRFKASDDATCVAFKIR